MKDEPSERLDPRAKTLWRFSAALGAVPIMVVGMGASVILVRFVGVSWLISVLPALAALTLVVLLVVVLPPLRWRWWRYEIRDDEVDLQRGIIWISRTLVPLARIQHVDTRHGPLQRWFGLATVVFHTAAGSNHIPELAAPVAAEVRDRIAALAQDDLDV